MIRVLSLYVLRLFLPPLSVGLLGFVSVFVVVDLVDRLAAFLDREIDVLTVVVYYVCFVPYIVVLVLPMAVLLGCLFCIGTMIRNRELLAMKATGVSHIRIFLPIYATALTVSLIAYALAVEIVPRANRRRARIEEGHAPARGRLMRSQVTLRDVRNQVFSIVTYFPEQMKGRQATLDRYRDGELFERIRAEEASWVRDAWIFLRGERRIFAEPDDMLFRFERLRIEGVTLRPEDFARIPVPEDQMTLSELRIDIQRKRLNGLQSQRERVALHLRSAFPFASLVIALFGVPLAARIRRTGRPTQVGVCLLTSFVFYGSIQAGRALGWNGILPPFWSAWGANVGFATGGILLLLRTRP